MSSGKIQMLVPEEREEGKIWYKGTADAIRQNLAYFAKTQAEYFLILSGDQLYNINFQEMIQFAVDKQADMVIAAQPVAEKEATRMGLLKIQPTGTELIDFYEKPKDPAVLKDYHTDNETLKKLGYHKHSHRPYLGSMGIYVFKREALFSLLKADHRDDFGKHLIMTQMRKGGTHVYLYDGYWEDIGTIESYYHANLALTENRQKGEEGFECYDEKFQIFSKSMNLPSAKIIDTHLNRTIISEGSIVEAREIVHSIVGVRSVIGKGTTIHDSILIGNEYYENVRENSSPSIGQNCLIKKAILDENVTLGNGVRLVNRDHHLFYDSPEGNLFVRDGIIIVPRGTILPPGFIF